MRRRAPSAAQRSGGTSKVPPRGMSRQHNTPTPPPPSSAPSSSSAMRSTRGITRDEGRSDTTGVGASINGDQHQRSSSSSARLSRPTRQQNISNGMQPSSSSSSLSSAANKKSLDELLRKATTYEEFMTLHKKVKVPSNSNAYDDEESETMFYKVRGPAPRQPQTTSSSSSASIVNLRDNDETNKARSNTLSQPQPQQKIAGQRQQLSGASMSGSGEDTNTYNMLGSRATVTATATAATREKYAYESAHLGNDLPNVTGPKTSATADVLSGFIRKRQQQQQQQQEEHEQRQQPKVAKASAGGIHSPSSSSSTTSPPPRHTMNLRKIFGELLTFHTSTCHLQVFMDGEEQRQQPTLSLQGHSPLSTTTTILARGVSSSSSSEAQVADSSLITSKDDIELLVEVLVGYNQLLGLIVDQSHTNNNTSDNPKERATTGNKKQEDFYRLFLFSLCAFSPSSYSSPASKNVINSRRIHRKLWRTLHDLVFHYARIMQGESSGDLNHSGEDGDNESEEYSEEEENSTPPPTGKPLTNLISAISHKKKLVSLIDSYWVEKERKTKNEEEEAHDLIDGHHEGGRRVNKSSSGSTSLGRRQDTGYSPLTNRKWDAREAEAEAGELTSFNFEKCLDATEWYFIMKCLAEADYPRIGSLVQPKLNTTVAFEGRSPLVAAVGEIPSRCISYGTISDVIEGCVEVLLAIIWLVQQGVDRFGFGNGRSSGSEERKGENKNTKDSFTSVKSVGGGNDDCVFAVREENGGNNSNNDVSEGRVYIESDVVAGELGSWWVEQLASEMGSPLHTFGGLLRVRNGESRSNDQILVEKAVDSAQQFLGAEKEEIGLDSDKDNGQNSVSANENENAARREPTPPCSAAEEDRLFLLTALYLDGGISLWPPPRTIVESSVENRVDQLKKLLSTTTSSQSSSLSSVGISGMPTTFTALTAMLRGTHLALNRIEILLQRRAEILNEMGGHSPTDYILACSGGLPLDDDPGYSCNGFVGETTGDNHDGGSEGGLSVSGLSPFDQHEKRLRSLRLLIEDELSYVRMLIPTNTNTTAAGTRQRGAQRQTQRSLGPLSCCSYAAFMPCVWERCFVETLQFLSNFVDTNISEKKVKFAKYGERGYERSKNARGDISVGDKLSSDNLASYGKEQNDIKTNKQIIFDRWCGNKANFERLAERIRNVEHAANSTWAHALRARVTAPEARALQQVVSSRIETIYARAKGNKITLVAQKGQRRLLDDLGEGLSPAVRKILQASTSTPQMFSSPLNSEKDASMPLSSRCHLVESIDVCTHLVGKALSEGFFPCSRGLTYDHAERRPRIVIPIPRSAFFTAAQWAQLSSLVTVTDNRLLFSRGSERCTSADLEVAYVQRTVMPHIRRPNTEQSAINHPSKTSDSSQKNASASLPAEAPHIVVAIRTL